MHREQGGICIFSVIGTIHCLQHEPEIVLGPFVVFMGAAAAGLVTGLVFGGSTAVVMGAYDNWVNAGACFDSAKANENETDLDLNYIASPSTNLSHAFTSFNRRKHDIISLHLIHKR